MAANTFVIAAELEARVAAAAARVGMTPDAFVLEAIEQTLAQAENEDAFYQEADDRLAQFLATGEAVPLAEAKAWLEARANGERPTHPAGR